MDEPITQPVYEYGGPPRPPVRQYVLLGGVVVVVIVAIIGVFWFVRQRSTTLPAEPTTNGSSASNQTLIPPRAPTPDEREKYGLQEDDQIEFITTPNGSYPVIVPGESSKQPLTDWDPSKEPPFEGKTPWKP